MCGELFWVLVMRCLCVEKVPVSMRQPSGKSAKASTKRW